MRYHLARSLNEALALLAAHDWQVLAGGTDVYPAKGDQPFKHDLLDISAIAALRGIRRTDSHWHIGAGVTWSDLLAEPLPPSFDGLKLAAHEVGSIQIQNAGTIAGNLCNASPAADGVPPLLTLDARVELTSLNGQRRIPLHAFVTGVRQTARSSDELVTAILVPHTPARATSHFLKLGARRYLVISIAMVAAVCACDDHGLISDLSIAIGACSPVARRLPLLEADARGKTIAGVTTPGFIIRDHLAGLAPISDVRGPADYRSAAAMELVRRTIAGCGQPDAMSGVAA